MQYWQKVVCVDDVGFRQFRHRELGTYEFIVVVVIGSHECAMKTEDQDEDHCYRPYLAASGISLDFFET
ncbi:hypothetical protein A2U01_0032098 [Trifolium medium]|uniref:Uncharacterized protein n=1 Tax=Trifolium medium TaxID=97028 RepID=A0A392PHN6_9FABA|nr:hypothetical protein [Trifolium medium]